MWKCNFYPPEAAEFLCTMLIISKDMHSHNPREHVSAAASGEIIIIWLRARSGRQTLSSTSLIDFKIENQIAAGFVPKLLMEQFLSPTLKFCPAFGWAGRSFASQSATWSSLHSLSASSVSVCERACDWLEVRGCDWLLPWRTVSLLLFYGSDPFIQCTRWLSHSASLPPSSPPGQLLLLQCIMGWWH